MTSLEKAIAEILAISSIALADTKISNLPSLSGTAVESSYNVLAPNSSTVYPLSGNMSYTPNPCACGVEFMRILQNRKRQNRKRLAKEGLGEK